MADKQKERLVRVVSLDSVHRAITGSAVDERFGWDRIDVRLEVAPVIVGAVDCVRIPSDITVAVFLEPSFEIFVQDVGEVAPDCCPLVSFVSSNDASSFLGKRWSLSTPMLL